MAEQNLSPVGTPGALAAEDNVSQLFQIAALMLGNEQEAVSLVEEVFNKVETDPCAEGSSAYAEARSLLARTAVLRMATVDPGAFAVPSTPPAEAGCLQISGSIDDLDGLDGDADVTEDPFGALYAAAGRAGMRSWLDKLTPSLRAIFVLRAVAGQSGEQTAESLRQSGANGAQGWRRDLVGTAYRQALCSLATCLVSARGTLLPA